MAQRRHIIGVDQSRETIVFEVCPEVSQRINIYSVINNAVFLPVKDKQIC